MRLLVSGAAVALSLTLLLPMAATAQEASPSASAPMTGSLVLQDPTGDLYDIATLEPTVGPAYTDLTGLEVTVDGEMLTVRFDVAETVPEAADPLYTTVHYIMLVDTDADDSPNFHIEIGSEEGWRADLFDYDTVYNTQLGEAAVADASLLASVPLADLGSPTEMRFQAVMEATNSPDPFGDPLNMREWGDRVPDAEVDWRALGDSDPIAVDAADHTVAALLSKKPAKIDKAEFQRVVKANAKTVAAYWKMTGVPQNTVPVITKRLMDLWDVEKPGQRTNSVTGGYLHTEFSNAMWMAQEAAKAGDAESATAFFSIARALHRMANSVLPPPRSWQEDWNKTVRQMAKDGFLD